MLGREAPSFIIHDSRTTEGRKASHALMNERGDLRVLCSFSSITGDNLAKLEKSSIAHIPVIADLLSLMRDPQFCTTTKRYSTMSTDKPYMQISVNRTEEALIEYFVRRGRVDRILGIFDEDTHVALDFPEGNGFSIELLKEGEQLQITDRRQRELTGRVSKRDLGKAHLSDVRIKDGDVVYEFNNNCQLIPDKEFDGRTRFMIKDESRLFMVLDPLEIHIASDDEQEAYRIKAGQRRVAEARERINDKLSSEKSDGLQMAFLQGNYKKAVREHGQLITIAMYKPGVDHYYEYVLGGGIPHIDLYMLTRSNSFYVKYSENLFVDNQSRIANELEKIGEILEMRPSLFIYPSIGK